MSVTLRRTAGVLSTFLLAAIALTGFAAPAHAEDGYRYWGYFHLQDGDWAFAEVGPADHTPEHGSVEAFRFGTSTPAEGVEPRADLDEVTFDTVCAGSEAGDGEKQVALLLDYGTDEGAGTPPEPRAECVVAPESASTQQVLEQAADVRQEGGMTCAIDGYPASGCGEPVPDAEITSDEEPVAFAMPDGAEDENQAASGDDGGSNLGLLVGVAALVVVLALVGLILARRNKAA